ncbi:MAG: 6-hydroxymethylpterin diphosphokinase MptE-like protein [Caryophanon sp.]|nr:6-hydroxymethylpterin diphosphokinase MptE-like protein [Caryophanon sp.]
MIFEVLIAKNGQATLTINGRFIYSKYRPMEEAAQFINNEYDPYKEGYVLIGLGLGYHAKILSDRQFEKPIYILCFDQRELELLKEMPFYEQLQQQENVFICVQYSELVIKDSYQIFIPNVWLQVIESQHPLYWLLQDIKMKQVSYKRFEKLLLENFNANIQHGEFYLKQWRAELNVSNVACLISSGPSLTEYTNWLKGRNDLFILCVGSALKALLQENIVPHAVIITDGQEEILKQLEDSGYDGKLFYLSTAAKKAVEYHKGERCILLQKGYDLAEKIAFEEKYPLLDTGGSVATTAYSLLHYFGFQRIVLFGQDLCVLNKQTHSLHSTSGRTVLEQESFINVQSNNGQQVRTLPNLYSYLQWFEYYIKKNNNTTVYNTSVLGAKIKGTYLIGQEEFKLL